MSSTSPDYYKFGDIELNTITGQLTGNAAQAVQYICRSSRLDGVNKNDSIEGRIEDLNKAIIFAGFEVERLEGELGQNSVPAPKWRSWSGVCERYDEAERESAGDEVVYDTWDDVPPGTEVRPQYNSSFAEFRIYKSPTSSVLFKDGGSMTPWVDWDYGVDQPDDYAPFIEV